jgi:MOSC domain-containing protein YiiM
MGHVERIVLRHAPNAEPVEVERATAVAGRGLEGDRYFRGTGTFSDNGPTGRHLTLIEAEALEALFTESGLELTPGEAGRNLVTRGIGLNALVGVRFRIGDVECRGDELCHPCALLEERTRPGVLRGLAGRGGLRADILAGGELAAGAPLEILG